MKSKRKTAILIPGFRLDADEFDKVMIGHLRDGQLGRGTMGVKTALELDADLIYWGGGGEARAIFNRVRNQAPMLERMFGRKVDHLFEEPPSVVGESGMRTALEMNDAFDACVQAGINNIILVSDMSHFLRCLLYLVQVRENTGMREVEINFRLSDTSFSDKRPLVAEPWTSYRRNLYALIEMILELDRLCAGNVDGVLDTVKPILDDLLRQARTGTITESIGQVLPLRKR